MSGVTTPPKPKGTGSPKKTPPRALNVEVANGDTTTAAASANNGTVDPRSPGVPRTPGGSLSKNKKTFTKTPVKSSSSGTISEDGEGGGEGSNDVPRSPLADFITQTDASGTPTHHRGRKSLCTQCGKPLATTPLNGTQTEPKVGSPKGKGAAADEEGGGGTSALCCCFQAPAGSNGQASPPGSPKGAGLGSPTGKGSANRKGATTGKANTGKKKGGGTFSTFHYDDPAHPADQPILPPVAAQDTGKLCLVLDLDETLVHSSFRAVPNPDYIIPVQIEDVVHHVYVCKRPGVDEYLRRCGERYEVVIYTASLNKYADPLLDKLDTGGVIRHRLFRESCTQYQGNYVKNLSLLGRNLETCIIVDNSPLSYLFHPENAVGCTSWIDQPDDDELRVIQDFCEAIEGEEDIRYHMRHWRQGKSYDPQTAYGD